ncbi:MAG: flagellin [Candidatus Melainabacteria bacterium]|nr:flagellin [Candidatus Melainabacteria bacterium]
MPLNFINTNINALKALKTLQFNTQRTTQAAGQIASGFKVARSSDDASAYSISQRMTNEIQASSRAIQNVQDGTSMLDVTEGALSTVTDGLQRIRELAVQLSSDLNSSEQRGVLAQEIRSIVEDVNRRSAEAQFNGVKLLDGTTTEARIQAGIGSDPASNTIDLTTAFANSSGTALKLYGTAYTSPARWSAMTLDDIYNNGVSQIDSSDKALLFLQDTDNAIKQLNTQRATVGAFSNQLQRAGDYLELHVNNLSGSKSRLVDTDVAKASAEYTQAQVLQNAATAILSQANVQNKNVLQLLQ